MNTGVSVSDVFTVTSTCSRSNTNTNTNTIKSSGYGSLPQARVHELEDQHEEEEEVVADHQPFSFPMLLPPSTQLQTGSNSQSNKELKHLELHHQLESLREKYIDMDIALPCAWESMKLRHSSKSSSLDSQEFDFSRSLRALDPASDTPADELFYKGQLLPLQCKLKDEGDGDEADEQQLGEEDAKAESFSFKSESGLLKDSGCISPDRFPSAAAAKTTTTTTTTTSPGLADSRSSSFRSSSSYWDSGDKDCGDSSSSCRDSNGSSTDSCFEAPTSQAPAAVVDATQESVSKVTDAATGKGSLNWRRSPFKWKVLLGGSRRASLSASSSCSSTSSASSAASRASSGVAAGAFKSLASERRRNHSFTYGSSHSNTSLSSSGPLLGSFFNAQGQFRHSVSSSGGGGGGGGGGGLSTKSLRKSEHVSSAHPSLRETGGSTSGNNSSSSSSSSTRVLHKYLKLLRPFGSSTSSSSSSGATSVSVSVSGNGTVTTGSNNLSLSSPSASTSTCSYTSSSGQRKSEPASFFGGGVTRPPPGRSLDEWRIYYEQQQQLQQQQHDKELVTCPSFLPGSLRVSSFSSRRSSTHASCVTSSRSSPNHSGVLKQCVDGGGSSSSGGSSSISSSMADLQSAIQGAIAHCKKSQTTTPCVSVRQPMMMSSNMSNNSNNWNNCGAPVVVVPPEPTTNNNNNYNNTKFVVVTQQLHAAGTLASALADSL